MAVLDDTIVSHIVCENDMHCCLMLLVGFLFVCCCFCCFVLFSVRSC